MSAIANASANGKPSAETRRFGMHPRLLMDVIQRQGVRHGQPAGA